MPVPHQWRPRPGVHASCCARWAGQHCGALLDEVGVGLTQDADKVVGAQCVERDADGESALELGEEVRRLGLVERARRDEQHVVRRQRA